MTREPIYAALFARLASAPGLVTSSRRLKHWSDVPAEDQPALFQAQRSEFSVKDHWGVPAKWTIHVDIYLYVHCGSDPDATPATRLNALLDSIEAALKPDPSHEEQDLGGLVKRCWISGKIETDEGALGEQAVAIIPVEITAF